MTNADFHGRSDGKPKPKAEAAPGVEDKPEVSDHEKAVDAAHAHHKKEARKIGMH